MDILKDKTSKRQSQAMNEKVSNVFSLFYIWGQLVIFPYSSGRLGTAGGTVRTQGARLGPAQS